MTTTANNLISRVLRRCFWPADSGTGLASNAPLTDADILAIADEEIAGDFANMVVQLGGEWFYAEADYAITATKARYRLPDKLFGPLIDVVRVDSAGNQISLGELDTREIGHRLGSSTRNFDHLVQGDFVRLSPTPTATQDTLRVKYHRQPGTLVLVANALQITSVSDDLDTSTSLEFGSDPAAIFSEGDEIDVVSDGNAHSLHTYENAITSVSNPAILIGATNNGEPTSLIAIGDWAVLSGTTPIVPLPNELLSALVKRVASECLRANGERDAAMREAKAADEAWTAAHSLLFDRSEAEPNTVITHNSSLRSLMNFGGLR